MAETLEFRGQQIGDSSVMVQTVTRALTPPVHRVGLWREGAAVAAESRNILHGRRFFVSIKRGTPLELDEVISLIQALEDMSGDVEVLENQSLRMRCDDWTLEHAAVPNLLPGFGGRFVAEYPLLFVGSAAPVYS